jgi:hypothetical protein
MKLRIKVGRAFVGGLAGALAVSAATGILRLLGVPINLELLVGSMLLGAIGPVVWLVGLGILIAAGGIAGIVYGVIFEHGMGAAGAGVGTTIGAVHAVFSGILMAFVPALHPLVPGTLAAPGPFLLGLGAWGVLLFLALHFMFGAIVGSHYGATRAEPRVPLGDRRRLHTRP